MLYPVKGPLQVYEDKVEILLTLQVFLAEDPQIEHVFCGAFFPALKHACSSAVICSACGWSLFMIIFNMTSLGWLIRLIGL